MDPDLIWEPPYPADPVAAANAEARKFSALEAVRAGPGELDSEQWVDVAFWIRPDGCTADGEILRSSRANPWSRRNCGH